MNTTSWREAMRTRKSRSDSITNVMTSTVIGQDLDGIYSVVHAREIIARDVDEADVDATLAQYSIADEGWY